MLKFFRNLTLDIVQQNDLMHDYVTWSHDLELALNHGTFSIKLEKVLVLWICDYKIDFRNSNTYLLSHYICHN